MGVRWWFEGIRFVSSWIGSSRVRPPPCAQITKMLIQVILYKEECVMGKIYGKTNIFVSE